MTQWSLVILDVWKKCHAFTFEGFGSQKDIIRLLIKICFIFWPSKSPLLIQSASTGNSHLGTRVPHKYEFQDRWFTLTLGFKGLFISLKKVGNCWTKSLEDLDRADCSARTAPVPRTVCPPHKVLHLTLVINMGRAHGYICNVSRLCDGNVG